ncbi:hypothetical protein D3C85_1886720 [compost metagenome]
MGMFEHRQRLAAIELHGELGAKVVETFVTLHCGENLLSQGASVEQQLPIDPGGRAEHQVAYIVPRCIAGP